jgi:hypothetical protein
VEKDGAKAGRADACSQEESFFLIFHKQMNYPRYPEDQLINHKQIPPTISGSISHEKHEQRCSEDLKHPLHHWGDSMVESVLDDNSRSLGQPIYSSYVDLEINPSISKYSHIYIQYERIQVFASYPLVN